MPSKRTLVFICFLAVIAVLLGLNYIYKPFSNSQAVSTTSDASPEPVASANPTIIDLSQLSSRQKVARLIAAPVVITDGRPLDASSAAWLSKEQPGAVTLFGRDLSTQTVATQVAELKAMVDLQPSELLIAVDHEGGTVQRLRGEGFTILPSWQTLCSEPATASAELLATSASEVGQVGVDIVFAPVADVALNHPSLRTRVCSDEPSQIVAMTQSYITAMNRAGVLPVVKHFPGIGATTRDLHTAFDRVTIEPKDALIYQALLTANPKIGVMTTHVGVNNQFPDIPCSLSLDCVGQITANYPQTLVVTDALKMKSAAYQGEGQPEKELPQIAEAAVRAGNQLLVFEPNVSWSELSQVIEYLSSKYEEDQVFQVQVDRAVTRLYQINR